MKKLLLSIALVSFCFSANAQDSKFGATAGYQSATLKASGGGEDFSSDASGFFLDIRILICTIFLSLQKLLVFNPNFSTLQ